MAQGINQGPPTLNELEDSVRKKLSGSILRRIEGARVIKRQADLRVFAIYSGTSEAALLLAALGVSHPVVAFMADNRLTETSKSTGLSAALASFSDYPWWLASLLGLVVVLWICIRFWVQLHKLKDRAPLMLACCRELQGVEADLEASLEQEQPLAGANELLDRAKKIVDRYFAQDVWPWPIGPDNIAVQVEARVDKLCNDYRHAWKVQP